MFAEGRGFSTLESTQMVQDYQNDGVLFWGLAGYLISCSFCITVTATHREAKDILYFWRVKLIEYNKHVHIQNNIFPLLSTIFFRILCCLHTLGETHVHKISCSMVLLLSDFFLSDISFISLYLYTEDI